MCNGFDVNGVAVVDAANVVMYGVVVIVDTVDLVGSVGCVDVVDFVGCIDAVDVVDMVCVGAHLYLYIYNILTNM